MRLTPPNSVRASTHCDFPLERQEIYPRAFDSDRWAWPAIGIFRLFEFAPHSEG